ncbi:hypothetical protein BDP27DRAFT_26623 [Rhodocollybia butyracea]|uniref:Uncharacterized protein n=1 Tax=Rhodocollybia butyracea TaxID=206335 RepID=A0A9P5UH68_9AGAR|nr:hypothetical protein BDP27DRAFT_26623 [Rhodocollybia butyracea]
MSIPHPHHTHSHIHQPQPSTHKSDQPLRPSLSSDVDTLSQSLRSTHVNDSSSLSGSSSESVKPSTIASSVSSRTSPSESSENSVSSPKLQSQSPRPPSMSHHHSHPRHPGTISIPPASFSLPMHNMSPLGVPMSPYYPGMSPLHHPAHGVPMTPHGLPPITPSMPPFTFLPPFPLPSPHGEIPHHMNGHSQMSDIVTPTYSHPPPVPSASEGSAQSQDQSSTSPKTAQEQAASSPVNPYFQSPTHHPHPYPVAHHQLTPFSPGLAMSPGAFWGRPGVAGAGPNPFINPAVGAPVHVVQGSPGGFYFHPHPSPGIPGSVGVEIGSGRAAEPGGYFDNVTYGGQGYFPPMQSYFGGLGTSSVEGEILKDKKDKEEDKEEEAKAMEQTKIARHERFSVVQQVRTAEVGTVEVEIVEVGSLIILSASLRHGMERPQLHRPDSDPTPAKNPSQYEDVTSTDAQS